MVRGRGEEEGGEYIYCLLLGMVKRRSNGFVLSKLRRSHCILTYKAAVGEQKLGRG